MPIIDPLVPQDLPAEWFLPTVHSVYFQIFSNMLSLPLSASQRDSLSQPRLLPLLDYLPIFDVTHAVQRPQDGQTLGLQLSMAAHGPMGLAAMTSRSIGHAMETIAKYAHIRNRLFDFQYDRADGKVRLLMHPRIPLGLYSGFIENATVFAKFSILRAIAHPLDWQQGEILLPWGSGASTGPASDNLRRLPGAPALGFQFPQDVADRPSALSDPELHRHICLAGDEELARLQGSISAKVRHFLHSQQPQWPSVDKVADALSMSRRTLLRKLETEKISYQQLLDEARNELACWYLRQSNLPLSHIAEKMGFSDQTNFSRSFKRWKGDTPNRYRQQFSFSTKP